MGKSSHFFGQPIYGQLLKSLDRDKIIETSRRYGGERYVKSFNGYAHLLTMLYAVIMRFDSLREIEASMKAEVRELHHIGLDTVPTRSTLSDANARWHESAGSFLIAFADTLFETVSVKSFVVLLIRYSEIGEFFLVSLPMPFYVRVADKDVFDGFVVPFLAFANSEDE